MAFKKRAAPDVSAKTPEKLFPLLPRTGQNSNSLWSQQSDLLREYAAERVDSRDLALELPTGTGKTLTGLLIADWRRREQKGRAVFACPTVQLVRQVVAAAQKEGIEVVDLSGSSKYWDATDKAAYERGRATAVVTYSAIFNSSPKLIDADVIIFDDAHAGEQYVSKPYTVEIRRSRYSEIYSHVVEAVKPTLSSERYHQLIQLSPGAGTRELVDGLFLAQRDEMLAPLSLALARFAGLKEDKVARSQQFAVDAIKEHLSACTLYLSWSKIELRPATPPTFENLLFVNAHQRVYLSATLGAAGELERAFGRPKIRRMALPDEAPTPKSGRKFLVFPHLVPDADPVALTKELIRAAGKSIVITPSDSTADIAKNELVPDSWKVFRKDDVEESFDEFTTAKRAVVILANRYDGIDLPGNACRAVTIAGFPGVTNLQEKFYAGRARSASVSEERVRTRVVQGIGRCTRHPRDWALVIVADPDTTTYLSRAEVRKTLSTDLQAEVEFGLDQSETSIDNVRENVAAFLQQSEDWRVNAEPEITVLSRSAVYEPAPGAHSLARAAKSEVEALERMWHGDWRGASDLTHAAAAELESSPDARGYRATLLFRAAVLMDKASRLAKDPTLASTADHLAERAVKAATPATWMNSFLPFEGRQPSQPTPALLSAAHRLSTFIDEIGSAAKLKTRISEMFDGLSQIDHKLYEPALTTLGKLVGADAFKPSGDARTDSAWCWDNELWITVEAKSEHKTKGTIGIDDVRQINGHLKLVADDRHTNSPTQAAAVMVSPRRAVRREGMVIADANTWLATPEDIIGLATDAERLWVTLYTLKNVTEPAARRSAVVEALLSRHLTPEDLFDRLTVTAIGNAGPDHHAATGEP